MFIETGFACFDKYHTLLNFDINFYKNSAEAEFILLNGTLILTNSFQHSIKNWTLTRSIIIQIILNYNLYALDCRFGNKISNEIYLINIENISNKYTKYKLNLLNLLFIINKWEKRRITLQNMLSTTRGKL